MTMWSNQSANFLKALVSSKEKNIDTLETIKALPSSYNASTHKVNLNSWEDIEKQLGYNQVIKTKDFNPKKFYIKNHLSKKTNFYKKIIIFLKKLIII